MQADIVTNKTCGEDVKIYHALSKTVSISIAN